MPTRVRKPGGFYLVRRFPGPENLPIYNHSYRSDPQCSQSIQSEPLGCFSSYGASQDGHFGRASPKANVIPMVTTNRPSHGVLQITPTSSPSPSRRSESKSTVQKNPAISYRYGTSLFVIPP